MIRALAIVASISVWSTAAASAQCVNELGIVVSVENDAGSSRDVCVYLVNDLGIDAVLHDNNLAHQAFVERVEQRTEGHAHLMSVRSGGRLNRERFSRDGRVLVVAFEPGNGGERVPLSELGGELSIRVRHGDQTDDVELRGTRTDGVPLRRILAEASYGAAVSVELVRDEQVVGMRHGWFRPRSGFAVDLSIAGTAVVFVDDESGGFTPELNLIPIAVRVAYRWFDNHDFYVFAGVGLAPYLSLLRTEEGADGEDSTDFEPRLPGVYAYGFVQIYGVELGGGARFDFDGDVEVAPMLMVTFTESVLEAVGVVSGAPPALVSE